MEAAPNVTVLPLTVTVLAPGWEAPSLYTIIPLLLSGSSHGVELLFKVLW